MNHINEKIHAENTEKDNYNIFESIYRFLQACLVEHICLLFIAFRQIFFPTKDISPIVAGFNIGFIIVIIVYLVKCRKCLKKTSNDENTKEYCK